MRLQRNPNVVLRRVTKHTWGPDPARVVVVAVLHDGEALRARVIGADGGQAVVLEEAAGVTMPRGRGRVRIAHPDGTEWELVGVGCSCQVPAALKGLNVLNVPAA